VCGDYPSYFISFRKLSELNKELFTVKISGAYIDTVSIAQYVNRNRKDVLILKTASKYDNDDALYAYIKKEYSWVEIKSEPNQKLEEKAKFIEKEA